jgi:molecular chaperone DnaK
MAKGKRVNEAERVTVLGIDLGTTNSTVSVATMSPSGPIVKTLNIDQETLQGTYTHTLVPSVVALAQGREWVGEGAKRLRGQGTDLYSSIFHDCKNDIGLKKTYHKAPNGYRSAAEIGGKVLRFLSEAAQEEYKDGFDRVVVTVPASFGALQRAETVEAARLAGIELQGGDLLDEPVAAFIDYWMQKLDSLVEELTAPKTLLVFDFGGGTCDVAIFRIEKAEGTERLNVATLAVSRYHRLGGGDVDSAILYEVLVPQLLQQNGLSTFDLEYRERKREVEPALIGTAEQLKIKMSNEIRKLQGFGKYDDADKAEVIVRQPGTLVLTVAGKTLKLSSPSLSAEQFETVLTPFLDHDLLYARETEYRLTCSMFAPVQDALDRAGISPKAVDLCLMVGGSSLKPLVIQTLDEYLPNARILAYQDKESAKECVSRGAARHALALATTGTYLVAPVCHDDIGIRTIQGSATLVHKGTTLPYPADGGYAVYDGLATPQAVPEGESCSLRVELVAGAEQRRLSADLWPITGPVEERERLRLEYRYDENQVLEVHLILARDTQQEYERQVEKPLSHIVSPHSKWERVLEIEEELKTAGLPRPKMIEKMVDLAQTYAELGQHDKAIHLLKTIMQNKNEPDAWLVNRIGMLYGEKGDLEKQEKFYKEAISISTNWYGPSFNLALSQKNRGRPQEAAKTLDDVLAKSRSGPYLVLRALVAEQMMDMPLQQKLLEEARFAFGPVGSLDQWALGWYNTCASQLCDEETRREVEVEIQRRAGCPQSEGDAQETGVLPMQTDTDEGR